MRTRSSIAPSFAPRVPLAIALLVCAACEARVPPPTPPLRDGGPPPPGPDGGIFVRRDGGLDGGVEDSGIDEDAAPVDASRPLLPVVDGVVDPDEWAGALVVASASPAGPPFTGDALRQLRAIRTDTRLFVAIEGTLATGGHAFLMYVDVDNPSDRGALLVPGGLSDPVGVLDRALSCSLFAAGTLRPELGWGTTRMPLAATGGDDGAGWRDIATRTTAFTAIMIGTQSACGADACETSIAIGPGGIVAPTTIAIFVRLGDGMGNLSNQTLPMDSPGAPENVAVVLTLDPP